MTFVRQTVEAADDPSELLAQALVLEVLKDRGRCRSLDYGTAITVHERDSERISGKRVPLALVSAGQRARRWWILADALDAPD